MEDIRQTKEWARYLQDCGWVVESIGSTSEQSRPESRIVSDEEPGRNLSVFIKKIPLIPFSVMKAQRFHGKLDFNDLKRLKKKYGVIYTVVEPALATNSTSEEPAWKRGYPSGKSRPRRLSFAKFSVNKRPFLPTKTMVVNLKKSKKELWGDLSINAKRILKKNDYTSGQIIFRKNDSSDEKSRARFYGAWKGSSKTWIMSRKIFNKLLDTFDEKASLWVSESEGKILSGILLLESKDTANYFQTFTTSQGRKAGAHYQLIWKVILECKRRGLKWFDFEGILDERWPQKKWAGFSEFKKKFGGKMVTYPGSFARWF